MSLISIQNILAPFSNRVHITAIFLVAIVFVVLRASGADVDTLSANEVPVPAAAPSLVLPDEDSEIELEVAKPKPVAKKVQAREADLLDEFAGADREAEARRAKAQEKPATDKNNSSFDEIEKSLGLR